MSNQEGRRARGFAAGVFIGLAIIMPVFAATSPGLEQWGLPLMAAATILLLLGVGIAAVGMSEFNVSAASVPRRRVQAVPASA